MVVSPLLANTLRLGDVPHTYRLTLTMLRQHSSDLPCNPFAAASLICLDDGQAVNITTSLKISPTYLPDIGVRVPQLQPSVLGQDAT